MAGAGRRATTGRARSASGRRRGRGPSPRTRSGTARGTGDTRGLDRSRRSGRSPRGSGGRSRAARSIPPPPASSWADRSEVGPLGSRSGRARHRPDRWPTEEHGMTIKAGQISRVIIDNEWLSVELGTFEVVEMAFVDADGEPIHEAATGVLAYRFTTPN